MGVEGSRRLKPKNFVVKISGCVSVAVFNKEFARRAALTPDMASRQEKTVLLSG